MSSLSRVVSRGGREFCAVWASVPDYVSADFLVYCGMRAQKIGQSDRIRTSFQTYASRLISNGSRSAGSL
jgi:hypothetical protein